MDFSLSSADQSRSFSSRPLSQDSQHIDRASPSKKLQIGIHHILPRGASFTSFRRSKSLHVRPCLVFLFQG